MKKQKSLIFILIMTIIALITIVILILNFLLEDKYIVNGYYKSEVFGDKYGFQHYTEYYKYYYDEKKDSNFSSMYNKVSKENIGNIKSYYDDFKDRMNAQNRIKEYDFNENDIDENDYFVLYDKNNRDYGTKYAKFYYYKLHYYDTAKHILYVLYVS